MPDTNQKTFRSNRGFSVIELLVVVTTIGILSAIAIPQMIAQRRQLRSNSVAREIMTQMRIARQLAMSDRQAVTFEYDDATKLIRIINHHNNPPTTPPPPAPQDPCVKSRRDILVAANYPNTQCSQVVTTFPLTQGGLPASEISYGIPPGLPTIALADTILQTPLTTGKLFITFQNDGSVIANTGLPQDTALFFYNNQAIKATASAISVVGASGRVKVWRYRQNGDIYAE